MTINELRPIYELVSSDRWIEAANAILKFGKNSGAEIKTKGQALSVCRSLCQHLLDTEQYLHAAILLWGGDQFSPEPESVQRVFEAMHKNSKTLFMGASSMGKSFNAGVWMYLDWRRDPSFTSVKCVGVSEDQVRKHVFAHIVRLHRAACIPMAEDVIVRDSDMWMGVKEAGYEFGITAIAYKQSQETSGGIKGYKSKPVRPKPHPKFGKMSRLRLLGDEGQNWPNGPFKDIKTWESQVSGTEVVKIAIAFNPESTSQYVVQIAEPEQGWTLEDMDILYDYKARSGWAVCRLDALRCENVIQKKEIYHGLQTYEGYVGYLKTGGDTSANYFTFARGWPPMMGTVNTVISPTWPNEAIGEATFIETPRICAAVDLAFMGKDSAQMAIGRWGKASGYRDKKGEFIPFKDRLNITKEKPRHVLQIDQIMPLQKHDNTVTMAEEIIGRCKMLGIEAEWLAVDKTGYGFGVHGHLTKVWGNCVGISWNEGATTKKILAEDSEGADKQADGVMSEMWWAFRRWLEPVTKAILINPIIPPQPIHTQLTSRRYEPNKGKGKGIKVEPKDRYIARNKNSPDEADAMMMLLHVVRLNSDIIPGTVEQQQPAKQHKKDGNMKWIAVKNMVATDLPDSIGEDPKDE